MYSKYSTLNRHLESKSDTSPLWLTTRIMPSVAHRFGIRRTIFTIAIWFATMVLRIYWTGLFMKKVNLRQSVKNRIQCMKVSVQPIKLSIQFHKKCSILEMFIEKALSMFPCHSQLLFISFVH